MRTQLWAVLVCCCLGSLVVGAGTATACRWPPPIEIIEPSGGSDASAGCDIVAVAQDSPVVPTSMAMYVDGTLVGTDDSADAEGRFSVKWAPAAETAAGEHAITAKATFPDGTVIESERPVTVLTKDAATAASALGGQLAMHAAVLAGLSGPACVAPAVIAAWRMAEVLTPVSRLQQVSWAPAL